MAEQLAGLLRLPGPDLCDRRAAVAGAEVVPGPPRATRTEGSEEDPREEEEAGTPGRGEQRLQVGLADDSELVLRHHDPEIRGPRPQGCKHGAKSHQTRRAAPT